MGFQDIIAALAGNDNNTRKQAEDAFKQLCVDEPQTVVEELLVMIQSAPDSTTRAFAPVLLRPLIEGKSSVYLKLDSTAKAALKLALLESLAREPEAHVRRQICHVIAELANVCQTNNEPWHELLATLSHLMRSNEPSFRETSLDLIAQLSLAVGATLLAPHKENFLTLFTNSLNDASMEVQIASLKASTAFVLTLTAEEEIQAFGIAVTPMLRITEMLLNNHDEATTRDILTSLINVAEVHPKFFRAKLDDIAKLMILIISSTQLDSETRTLALEFLVTMSESAGSMIRKAPHIISSLVPLAISLMAEVEDDPTWKTKFDDLEGVDGAQDSESNPMSDAASAAMDRLSTALGGNAILPVAIPVIKSFLGDGDWKKRRAGLLATSLSGEGSKKVMLAELDNVVNMVLPYLSDPHERVQYAAIFSIGLFTDDFGEVEKGKNFQAKFHTSVLPALISIIGNNHIVMRSRALAATVVEQFANVNVCKAKYVSPYAEKLLEALFTALRSGCRQVQEAAISAVAHVAKVIGTEFQKFYDIFIPVAKDVLLNAQGNEYALLRGKAMESIALIGQAVGKDRFANDAKEVMEILVRVQNNEELEGIEVQYVAQACVRIGNILKADFVPYLPHIMPPLLKQACIQPDVQLLDIAAGDDVDNDVDGITIDHPVNGTQRLRVNTSALEEKTNACQMLYQCALDLEGAFYPYIREVASIIIPLLKFQYVDDIRIVSSLTMARLLNCAIDGTINYGHGVSAPEFPQQLLLQLFEPLLQALQEEDELECLSAFAEACSALLEVVKEGGGKPLPRPCAVPLENTPFIVNTFIKVAGEAAHRLVSAHKLNENDADFDEEAAMQQLENDELDEGIFRSMVDSIGWIIKSQKQSFFPVFEQHLLPFIQPLLQFGVMPSLRGQAICMVDDVIEHCGSEAQKLLPMFIEHLLEGLSDSSGNVVQASAYGIGVCAEKLDRVFDQFVNQALEKLVYVINASGSLKHEDEQIFAARDNAISAVAKLCLHRSELVDAVKIWPIWLQWLPLQVDVIEARDVHSLLIRMVEEGNGALLGPSYSNLPLILKVFALILMHDPAETTESLGDDVEEDFSIISNESKMQLATLLANLQRQLAPEIIQASWDSLSPNEKQALSSL